MTVLLEYLDLLLRDIGQKLGDHGRPGLYPTHAPPAYGEYVY